MTNIAKMPTRSTTVGYVASEIRAQAARKGLSGRQLAFQIGKSQPWMSRRLTGEVPFDVEELDAVARALDVEPRVFFPDTDSNPGHSGGGMTLTASERRVVLALRSSASEAPASEVKSGHFDNPIVSLAERRATKLKPVETVA